MGTVLYHVITTADATLLPARRGRCGGLNRWPGGGRRGWPGTVKPPTHRAVEPEASLPLGGGAGGGSAAWTRRSGVAVWGTGGGGPGPWGRGGRFGRRRSVAARWRCVGAGSGPACRNLECKHVFRVATWSAGADGNGVTRTGVPEAQR